LLATAFDNDKIDDSALYRRLSTPPPSGTRFNHVNEKQRKKEKRERRKNPRNSAAVVAASLDGARWKATKIPPLVAGGRIYSERERERDRERERARLPVPRHNNGHAGK